MNNISSTYILIPRTVYHFMLCARSRIHRKNKNKDPQPPKQKKSPINKHGIVCSKNNNKNKISTTKWPKTKTKTKKTATENQFNTL